MNEEEETCNNNIKINKISAIECKEKKKKFPCEEILFFLKDVAPFDMYTCFINDLPRGTKLPLIFPSDLKAQFSRYFYLEKRKNSSQRFILPCIIDGRNSECVAFGWPSDWPSQFALKVLQQNLICIHFEFIKKKLTNKKKDRYNEIQNSLLKQGNSKNIMSKIKQNGISCRASSCCFSSSYLSSCFSSSSLCCASTSPSLCHLSNSCMYSNNDSSSTCYNTSISCNGSSECINNIIHSSISSFSPCCCPSNSPCLPVSSQKKSSSAAHYGSFSSNGIRSYNEDRILHIDNLFLECASSKDFNNSHCHHHPDYNYSLYNNNNNNNYAMYFGVYDGHNGEEAVEYVMKNLHKNVCKNLGLTADKHICAEDISESMKKAFQTTDKELCTYIFCEKNKKKEDEVLDYLQFTSGCTACVCFYTGKYLVIGNLGDSRVVISRGGVGVPLSEVHRINSNKTEQNRVLSTGGTFDSDGYIAGCLGVSRAFGDFNKISKEKIVGLSNDPEIYLEELRKEDEFMIIACDGIYDVMTPQETITFVRKYLMSCNDPAAAAKYLCEIALARKSLDNVSAIVVLFQSPEKTNETSSDLNSSLKTDVAQNSQNTSGQPPPRRVKMNFSALKALL